MADMMGCISKEQETILSGDDVPDDLSGALSEYNITIKPGSVINFCKNKDAIKTHEFYRHSRVYSTDDIQFGVIMNPAICDTCPYHSFKKSKIGDLSCAAIR
jgi:hypothetical protein